MIDLIDRAALIRALNKISMERHEEYVPLVEHDFREVIRKAEAVDAVPVVRCKDCKCWEARPNEDEEDNVSNGYALHFEGVKMCQICGNGFDYCSYGRRRDDE